MKKAVWACVVCLLLACIVTFSLLIIVDSGLFVGSDSNNDVVQGEYPHPELFVPNKITLDILDTDIKFTFSIKNSDFLAPVLIIENNAILKIDNFTLVPLQVGATTVHSFIEDAPSDVHTTQVIITQTEAPAPEVSSVKLEVLGKNDENATKLFTNTDSFYKLKVTLDTSPTTTFTLLTSENILLGEHYGSSNTLTFLFKVKDGTRANFEFKIHNLSEKASLPVYNLVSFIDVKFDNLNDLKLYLYNTEKESEANADGYFSHASFTISTNENILESIAVTSSNKDVLKVEDSTIYAISQGSATLTFISTISNFKVEILVTVEQIQVLKLQTQTDITLEENQKHTLTYSLLPTYALSEIQILTNSPKLTLQGNQIYSETAGVYTLTILEANTNTQIDITVTVTQPCYYNITAQNAKLEQDGTNITIYTKQNDIFLLKAYLCNANTQASFDLDIQDEFQILDYVQSFNGNLSLSATTEGEIAITLTHPQMPPQQFTIKIVFI